jgi:AcrR family transcriptional regulator
LINAAVKLFEEQGFKETTTNQIAKEAGIASGTGQ